MRILLFTRYGRLGASSRVRSLQYLSFLEKSGWKVDVSPLFSDAYIQALYGRKRRGGLVVSGFLQRLKMLGCARKYDLIWIEKELFPFMPAWAERYLNLLGVPYVVDYDDALFHRYDSHRSWLVRALLSRKIDAVMRHAALVVAGNQYLADHAHTAGARRVEIIPTVVDLERYSVSQRDESQPLTIGWIGSPGTSRYLRAIASALESVASEFKVRFVAVGASMDAVEDLPVEVWPWSEETEVESIDAFDIGIMPLPDEPWEQGKCGYKLIQYMACGRPIVASPVGVNTRMVENGINGFLANTEEEWKTALAHLLRDKKMRDDMGLRGRELVEAEYCLQVQAPRLELLLRGALR
jgi:glycosyltransferase involved in cell wall biosynthesis